MRCLIRENTQNPYFLSVLAPLSHTNADAFCRAEPLNSALNEMVKAKPSVSFLKIKEIGDNETARAGGPVRRPAQVRFPAAPRLAAKPPDWQDWSTPARAKSAQNIVRALIPQASDW